MKKAKRRIFSFIFILIMILSLDFRLIKNVRAVDNNPSITEYSNVKVLLNNKQPNISVNYSKNKLLHLKLSTRNPEELNVLTFLSVMVLVFVALFLLELRRLRKK